MASAVTASMPPPQPDPLQECLKIVGMFTAGDTSFMQNHQLVTIEDMLLFLQIEAQDLMNIYNGQKTRETNKFGMDVQKKVVASIYWARDIQQRKELIIFTFWTQPQIVLSVR